MASNPCKRRRTDLNEDKKREICVYKNAHPIATGSDIAVHFVKEWGVTVGRTTGGDILRSKKSGCLMSALVEQQNMASLKKHLSSCNIFEIIKSCNYIFEIKKLYIYVVILFAQLIHVLI